MRVKATGFTLAELLIALAILGLIATFTIPNLLNTQQSGKFNAITKEAASMISQAHAQLQAQGKLTPNTPSSALTTSFNYVNVDTSGTLIDDISGNGSKTCNATTPCFRLHNGATLMNIAAETYTTNGSNMLNFFVDPDGVYSGTTNGSGKSVNLYLLYNGRLTTRGIWDSDFTEDPVWLKW